MFTGIIEKTARVVAIEKENTNFHFTLEVDFGDELAIDQSMAHDGCCLTVVRVDKEKKQYVVTAMDETMLKTNLSTWQVGTEVNVERSMRMDGRFDGHIVQGHVDQTATCTRVVDENGSWRYRAEGLHQHQLRQSHGCRLRAGFLLGFHHSLHLRGDQFP